MGYRADVAAHHRVTGPVTLASGIVSDSYIDIRAAMLCGQCASMVTAHFQGFLIEHARRFGSGFRVVGTGTFGAMLLARLYGVPRSLWLDKDHGVPWVHSHTDEPMPTRAVIVDDVRTTGGTLARLEAACEAIGLTVEAREIFYERSQ